jgi:hypothetical protein
MSIPEPNSGCLLWTGAAHRLGYGQVVIRGKKFLATRLAWELAHGPIPAGLCICHKCDVAACINVAHLFLGTQRDNMIDKIRKGRANMPRGTQRPDAKLTEEKVRAIRSDPRSVRAIARDYGVVHGTIVGIKSRRDWAHVK